MNTEALQLCRLFKHEEVQRELFTRWHNCAWRLRPEHGRDRAEQIAFGRLIVLIIRLGYEMSKEA